jgi:hypothetical protein
MTTIRIKKGCMTKRKCITLWRKISEKLLQISRKKAGLLPANGSAKITITNTNVMRKCASQDTRE